jgi:hypothetical protein
MITQQGRSQFIYTLHKTVLSGRSDQGRVGETCNTHEGNEKLQHICRKTHSEKARVES